jgi:glutamate racemase
MVKGPIGIFDSGVGGISIWREIHDKMPLEDTLYLADSKNAPYGQKSKKDIIALCEKNTEYLLNQNCKIIVVACNTATTMAIKHLRNKYNVPFIGIEPAIKPAALGSKSKKIGVLATKGTLSSSLFQKTSKEHAGGIQIIEQVGNGLVELVEEGKINSNESIELLKAYLDPMIAQGVDKLVLGCTHYPFLTTAIKQLLPDDIDVIDSGDAVAKHTKYVLSKKGLLRSENDNPRYRFLSNSAMGTMKIFLSSYKNLLIEQADF